ncbi:MAG: S41 family peptidase [Candidatus Zapsychrus exili]|nr:S41 family peptidase [Candidatus Zapsychrus exili]
MIKKFFAVFTVLTLLSISTYSYSEAEKDIKDDLYSQIELFSYSLTTIQSDYVEKLSPQELIYGSLKGMLSSLDPHSQFLKPEEYIDLKTETQGKFGGLGIEISVRDGLLTVITPIEDTPAWDAGLKPGDRIVKIEDELTKNITLSEAVKKLRGDPGTEVNITVLREKPFELLEISIIREIIHIQDVKNTQILKDGVGYIRLVEFREDSAKEFRKALDELKEAGADSLILDLRNNPGGLLNVAIKITEEFVPEGQTIVSTKGRRLSQNTLTISTNKNHLIDWPIVVLINAGSASGSEILAGALKDNKLAVIVGTKSFGKGSVQSVIPLPDGSGLRLTTSKYFTPSGESIHEKGIEPDIVVEPAVIAKDEKTENEKKVEAIFDDIENKNKEEEEEAEAEEAEETEEDISKKAAEIKELLLGDNQIQTAINILKGLKVFKGLDSDEIIKEDVKIEEEIAEETVK